MEKINRPLENPSDYSKDDSNETEKKTPYPVIDKVNIKSQDFKILTEKKLFAQFAALKQAEVVKSVSEFLALTEQKEFKKLLETLNDRMTLLEALKFLKQMVEEVDLKEAKEKGLDLTKKDEFPKTVH